MASPVEDIAAVFWHSAGGRTKFGSPVAIDRAVPRALPAAVVRIDGLNTDHVQSFLARIGAEPWVGTAPRGLRGCLIADAGSALILVDGSDPEDEQRVTVAHE